MDSAMRVRLGAAAGWALGAGGWGRVSRKKMAAAAITAARRMRRRVRMGRVGMVVTPS
jgi:hypothetical protein